MTTKITSIGMMVVLLAGCASLQPPPKELRMSAGTEILIVPVGTVNMASDQSIFGGNLGLLGIAIDALAKSGQDFDAKSKKDQAALADQKIQEFFANEVAQGLQACGYRTTVAKEVLAKDAKHWSKDHDPLSGSYALGKKQQNLLETRVHSIEIVKNLLNADMCVRGFAKQYSTDKLIYQHTYTAWNKNTRTMRGGMCNTTLDHYSKDDPERDTEVLEKGKVSVKEVAGLMAEQICKDNDQKK